MILIADCGSTKIDWCLLNGGEKVAQIFTTGMNALLLTQEEMTERIRTELMPHIVSYDVTEIHYYGAGIISDEIRSHVVAALQANIPGAAHIEVETDLVAAARALCGHKPGIACILGTGSNSCYYDGERIVDNVSPLGYILGDEGSGAVLGKLLVGDVLKHQLPEHLCEAFLREYETDRTDTGVGQEMTAEQWITDEYALTRNKQKLARYSGKFRSKTIDRKDFIFNRFANLLK
jgi:N-acetylglucosamine kinase-like BadF-type ATPase